MLDPRAIQRRTLRLLFVTQIISGVGVTTGSTVRDIRTKVASGA